MAVKIHCSSCGNFIKDAKQDEIQKITGKEICGECAAKINGALKFIDDTVADFKKNIEKMVSDAKKDFGNMDKVHNKFLNTITSLHTTTSAELRRRVQDTIGE